MQLIRYSCFLVLLILAISAGGLVSCSKSNLAPVIISDESTTVTPTLVSIQSLSTNRAEIIVKAGFQFGAANWRLVMWDATGRPLSLTASASNRLELFNLTAYQASGLTAGQTYRLQFATRNAGGDSLYTERLYTHSLAGPHWVRRGNWQQYRGPDLPEPTGTLATFRLGTTGYVVNQRPGQAIHLWAFDTQQEQWSRKADFPGSPRSQGIGFSAAGNGYFGLGINAGQETLRDVWQYDPAADRWQYVTDYPGAGSTALAVGQLPNHTLLGLGYEHQPTSAGGIRLVGCTDF